jgi:hypothetical protein
MLSLTGWRGEEMKIELETQRLDRGPQFMGLWRDPGQRQRVVAVMESRRWV